jgi:hypothetical protein
MELLKPAHRAVLNRLRGSVSTGVRLKKPLLAVVLVLCWVIPCTANEDPPICRCGAAKDTGKSAKDAKDTGKSGKDDVCSCSCSACKLKRAQGRPVTMEWRACHCHVEKPKTDKKPRRSECWPPLPDHKVPAEAPKRFYSPLVPEAEGCDCYGVPKRLEGSGNPLPVEDPLPPDQPRLDAPEVGTKKPGYWPAPKPQPDPGCPWPRPWPHPRPRPSPKP